MPKKSVKAEVKTFVKGLITEASPLNFPENASLDERNFELLKNGTRQRRLGMDYEPSFEKKITALYESELPTTNISTFIWEGASGIADKNFVVVQVNNILYFYDLAQDYLSNDGFTGSVTLPSAFSAGKKHSFASVEGVLVVATGSYEIYYVTYNSSTNSFSYNYYTLKVRDFWGIDDETINEGPYYRPATLTYEHLYNLYNQSWGVPRRWQGAEDLQVTDPADYYRNYYGYAPSNSEVVWTAITTKAADDPYEYMRPNAWAEVFGSSPPASKGYFIIDVLKRGASRAEALLKNQQRFPEIIMGSLPLKQDYTPGGAKVVTEFAGRVFYAGFSGQITDGNFNSPILSNYVLFSQLVRGKSDLAKCYQEGDPTSREGNDIVDTDGGYIAISGAQNIIAMENVGSSLVVIASNGVWRITGGSDYGFSATNYKVEKISTFGGIAADSVVKAGDSILYWGANAIYSVVRNQTGDFTVTSITDETIQSFYSEISTEEKANVIGIYDDVGKTIRWIYSSSYGLGTPSQELVLDTRLGAFYVYDVNALDNTVVRGMFSISPTQELITNDPVLVGIEQVQSTTLDVMIPFSSRTPSKSGVKYLVFVSNNDTVYFTFAYYCNQSFLDWESEDTVGVDAQGYLLTGAITANDSSVDKQAPYVTVHMYRTENGVDAELAPTNQSGCLMHGQWGWSNSINSNKWGRPQQVYRYTRGYLSSTDPSYDTGFELITTKNKVRGSGKALSLYFETEAGKDCKLVGWNININGNSVT